MMSSSAKYNNQSKFESSNSVYTTLQKWLASVCIMYKLLVGVVSLFVLGGKLQRVTCAKGIEWVEGNPFLWSALVLLLALLLVRRVL